MEKVGAFQDPIIDFENFSFKYYIQSEPTLKNINLKIYEGEKVLIVGPSGSGKTTLGHTLNGLIPFYYKGEIEGSLKIRGVETRNLSIFELSKIVGTVLQDADAQFLGLTVGEDIAFSLENDNVLQDIMKRRVRKVAEMVGMEEFLDQSPFELSGGQKQRTTVAGVLVDDVPILLFDEPLANLDPLTGKKAIEIIDEIHSNTKKTVIIIEHRIEDVLHRSVDRVVVINDGRIVGEFSPHELVSVQVLNEIGLREPLYISALKYADVEVTVDKSPGYIETLKLSERDVQHLKDWREFVSKNIERVPIKKDDVPLLKVENVNFSYDPGRPVLKNINFEVNKGEIIALVGKNGAGKSTLAKVLCGFVNVDSGNIYINGENINNRTIKERAEYIGFVMQDPNQMISKQIVYDEVSLGLHLRKLGKEEIEERVNEIAAVCGIKEFLKWPIQALSYGQKKRVTIASILVLKPSIVILDEPTAGQDFKHYSEIMNFLSYLNSLGMTFILITHDMHLMLEYAHRTIVLSSGEIIANDVPSKILTNREVIEKANLKETSLFELAERIGENPTEFVQCFIDYERNLRGKNANEIIHF